MFGISILEPSNELDNYEGYFISITDLSIEPKQIFKMLGGIGPLTNLIIDDKIFYFISSIINYFYLNNKNINRINNIIN